MRKLARRIETELKEQNVCAVYNSELARVFPKNIPPGKRKQQIKHFAEEHHLSVSFYDVGLCAVFEKPNRAELRSDVRSPIESIHRASKRKRSK